MRNSSLWVSDVVVCSVTLHICFGNISPISWEARAPTLSLQVILFGSCSFLPESPGFCSGLSVAAEMNVSRGSAALSLRLLVRTVPREVCVCPQWHYVGDLRAFLRHLVKYCPRERPTQWGGVQVRKWVSVTGHCQVKISLWPGLLHCEIQCIPLKL